MPGNVMELTDSTRTAAEAALAIGCDVAQIAKSLIFRSRESGKPVLVVASGVNRVNERLLARNLHSFLAGEKVERADAMFVREVTGYAIGGVPPIGHTVKPVTLVDRDLMQFDTVWAAAGTPNAVFPVSPDTLLRITGGVVDQVS